MRANEDIANGVLTSFVVQVDRCSKAGSCGWMAEALLLPGMAAQGGPLLARRIFAGSESQGVVAGTQDGKAHAAAVVLLIAGSCSSSWL